MIDPDTPLVPRGTPMSAIIAAVAEAGGRDAAEWTGEVLVRRAWAGNLRIVAARMGSAAGHSSGPVGRAIGWEAPTVVTKLREFRQQAAGGTQIERRAEVLRLEARALELLVLPSWRRSPPAGGRAAPLPQSPTARKARELRRLGWTIEGIGRQLGLMPTEVAGMVGEPDWTPARRTR